MQERRQLADELGCPGCAEAFKEGQEVQEICLEGAGSEQECQNTNPGSNFTSAVLPTDLKTSGCGVRLVHSVSSASSPKLTPQFATMTALLMLVSLVMMMMTMMMMPL